MCECQWVDGEGMEWCLAKGLSLCISITIFSNDLTEYIVVYCVVNLESNCPSFSFTALVSLKMGVVVCLLEHCCCWHLQLSKFCFVILVVPLKRWLKWNVWCNTPKVHAAKLRALHLQRAGKSSLTAHTSKFGAALWRNIICLNTEVSDYRT